MPPTLSEPDVDTVIIGGGFGGLYATHRLRNVLGLRVQSFDAGSGPGGTWYWNRYPGARCDIESISYSYSFDEDLQREWRWTEQYAGQPEILAYLNHVADRYDLRRSYEFDTRVTSTVWSDTDRLWTVGTDTGRSVTARYVVAAPGSLSLPKVDEFPGLEDFQGEILRTSAWRDGVDLTGKRVAVIGTGSTGIQVIPEVARVAGHLTVFQRTPNFACPLGNRPLTAEEMDAAIADYPEMRRISRTKATGLPLPDPAAPSALMVDEDTRRRVYDTYYNGGGFRMVASTFLDLLYNKAANDTAADYIREKIRSRVKDPKVAEMLVPGDDHPYGTKRPPFETQYYEAFNRDNVTLVDVRAAPIETITPTGLRTSAGEHEFDVLILATGFDALTGPILALNITGRDGVPLKDVWAAGPQTYLGIGMHGFPNLFAITGPQSPSVTYNYPLAIEDHVDFVGDVITMMRERGAEIFEATEEAALRWPELVRGLGNLGLLRLAKNSWYLGTNVPGKPRSVLLFAGGAPLYRAICAQVQDGGYGGFAVDGTSAPLPALLDIDPAMLLLVGGMLAADPRQPEELSLEELRGMMSRPGPVSPHLAESVDMVTTTYPSGDHELPVRVYVPRGRDGDLPVVVFLHPGGWIAGSIEAVEETCRGLADEVGAVVIAPSYRLAPEHPFPAATDDTVAALRWVAKTAREYHGDPGRIAVVGESSGANLAAVAAHRVRDEGGPELTAQVLVYPPVAPDADTESRRRHKQGPVLSTALLDQMWSQYLKDPAAGESPLAAPAKAPNTQGLPPTLVVTVEVDPVRDEAEAYGHELAAAGCDAEVVRIPGLVHGSLGMTSLVPRAIEIRQALIPFLRTRLAASDRPAARQ